ncbi:hypothetical protein HKD37_10G028028 [Glycine soja]
MGGYSASNVRTKKKILQTVRERWRQFKSDLKSKWALAADKDSVDDTIKKKLEEVVQSESTKAVIDPPSPIRRHVKWKIIRTKKTSQMTSEAAKEIAEKIASQGSFVPHRRQDVLTAAIGRPEHPGRVHAAGAGGLALPSEPEDGPLAGRVSTKGSCVDPSGNDPDTGDSDKYGLYIEENPPCLVALGRVYDGSTTVHNIPLLHDQVNVGIEQVKDADAPILVPTDKGAVGPVKLADRSDHEFDDPLYLMTLTIPQLFLKSLQVMWDATVFGVFNEDFPLYIKHEDLSEIAHGGQCLSISVKQLWILHLTETSMRASNSDVYGFLEPESIQRSRQSQFESESYMTNWMQNSKRDVYLRAYLNGPDNYLKGIINSALKGLNDTPQPKSKASARWIVVKCNRQKGSTECGYYVMHWMSTIILGSFKNNWETYLNDVRPLEAKRLKALRIQWAKYYLKVRNQT